MQHTISKGFIKLNTFTIGLCLLILAELSLMIVVIVLKLYEDELSMLTVLTFTDLQVFLVIYVLVFTVKMQPIIRTRILSINSD